MYAKSLKALLGIFRRENIVQAMQTIFVETLNFLRLPSLFMVEKLFIIRYVFNLNPTDQADNMKMEG